MEDDDLVGTQIYRCPSCNEPCEVKVYLKANNETQRWETEIDDAAMWIHTWTHWETEE